MSKHPFFALFHRIPNHRPLIWLVATMNLLSGAVLCLYPSSALVTGYRFLGGIRGAVTGLILLAAGVCGLIALIIEHKDNRPGLATFWLLFPQQIVLMLVAAGAVVAIINGRYYSGTVLPVAFIFVDQLPKILIAIFHPFALLAMHISILPNGVGEEVFDTGEVANG